MRTRFPLPCAFLVGLTLASPHAALADSPGSPVGELFACEACGGEPGDDFDDSEGREDEEAADLEEPEEPEEDPCDTFDELRQGEAPTAIVYLEDERVPGSAFKVLSCMGYLEKLCPEERVLLCGPDGMDDFQVPRQHRLAVVARATEALELHLGTARHVLAPACDPADPPPCDRFEVRIPFDIHDHRDRVRIDSVNRDGFLLLAFELNRRGSLVARGELNISGLAKAHALAPYRFDADLEDPTAALVTVQDILCGALPSRTEAAIERVPWAAHLEWRGAPPPLRCEPARERPGVSVLAAPWPGPTLRIEERLTGQTSEPTPLPDLPKGTVCPSTVSVDLDAMWVVHAYRDRIDDRLAKLEGFTAPPRRPIAPDAFVPFGLSRLTVTEVLERLGGDRGALAKLLGHRYPGVTVGVDHGGVTSVAIRAGVRFEDLRALGLDPLIAAFVDAPVEHLIAVLGPPTRRTVVSPIGLESVVYEVAPPRRPMQLRAAVTAGRVTALNFEAARPAP
jgi:hypothetical protein